MILGSGNLNAGPQRRTIPYSRRLAEHLFLPEYPEIEVKFQADLCAGSGDGFRPSTCLISVQSERRPRNEGRAKEAAEVLGKSCLFGFRLCMARELLDTPGRLGKQFAHGREPEVELPRQSAKLLPSQQEQAQLLSGERGQLVLSVLERADLPLAVFDPAGEPVVTSAGFRRYMAGLPGASGRLHLDEALNGAGAGFRLQALPVRDGEDQLMATLVVPSDVGLPAFLEDLASHVAHEIRNPLGTIAGFAALLEREFSPDDRRARWVRRIVEAVGRLDRMVTQLYLYVHPVKSQLRPVDLIEKTREVFSFAEVKFSAHQAKVRFEYEFPEEPVYVLLDPQWWQEVVLTICSNAVEALRDGGEVRVRIVSLPEEARVIISDNGCGVPEEMRGRLFWPFFSSKPDGTGLGLAVARKLLASMGASIELSPGEQGGTVVTITFQAA